MKTLDIKGMQELLRKLADLEFSLDEARAYLSSDMSLEPDKWVKSTKGLSEDEKMTEYLESKFPKGKTYE